MWNIWQYENNFRVQQQYHVYKVNQKKANAKFCKDITCASVEWKIKKQKKTSNILTSYTKSELHTAQE